MTQRDAEGSDAARSPRDHQKTNSTRPELDLGRAFGIRPAREFEPSHACEARALGNPAEGRPGSALLGASALRGQCATAGQTIDEKLLKCSVVVQLDSHG